MLYLGNIKVIFRQLPRSFFKDSNASGKCELPYQYLENPAILPDEEYKRILLESNEAKC